MTYIVSIPTLVTIITSIFTKTNANKCHISVSGIFLQGHVLSSYRAENIHACYETCQEKTGCLSINFYRESFICELNNRSIAQKPSKKGLDEMAVYFAKVNPGKNVILLFKTIRMIVLYRRWWIDVQK